MSMTVTLTLLGDPHFSIPDRSGRLMARCRPSTTRMSRLRRFGWSAIISAITTPNGPRSPTRIRTGSGRTDLPGTGNAHVQADPGHDGGQPCGRILHLVGVGAADA